VGGAGADVEGRVGGWREVRELAADVAIDDGLVAVAVRVGEADSLVAAQPVRGRELAEPVVSQVPISFVVAGDRRGHVVSLTPRSVPATRPGGPSIGRDAAGNSRASPGARPPGSFAAPSRRPNGSW